MVNYGDYEGEIRITYRPAPAKITALTQTLEISDGAAAAAAHYLAMHFAESDQNDSLKNLCKERYQEVLYKTTVKKPLAPSKIRDVYGIGNIR
jgi:hypothetical protein